MARMRSALVVAAAAVTFAAAALGAGPESQAPVTSLLGEPLAPLALEPGDEARMQAQLAEAVAAWEKDTDDADALIWVGRRTAYLGRYREAIDLYTQGIARHPADARMYRHRGHRYLTVREIDRAIADLEKADALIAGSPDEVEPDGLPNARNVPTSTLNSNVWYHLALAYYLQGDFNRAADTWRRALDAVANADNRVASGNWLYLALRRAGRDAEAARVLGPVTADLDVIENGSYHQLLLMYKGERTPEALLAAAETEGGDAAVRYGVSAWMLVTGRRREAEAIWARLLAGPDWAAFGHLAAEAEVARPTWKADHHVHLASPDLCRRVGDCLGSNNPPAVYATDAVRALDVAGVAKGVVLSCAYLYGLRDLNLTSAEVARWTRLENEFTANEVTKFPGRLAGFLSLDPLQPSALDELAHWRGSAALGGLKLHFATNGVDLGDASHRARVGEVVAAAAADGLPMVIHVGGRGFGPREAAIFIDEILPRAGQSAIQIAHAAGGVPMPIDDQVRVLGLFADRFAARDPVTERVSFDLSFVPLDGTDTHGAAALADALRRIGIDRFRFGSDFNVESPAVAQVRLRRLGLTPAELARIAGACAPWAC
jgi:predicted TIM-barrel fold metal-dependent hydrolase